MNSVAASSSVPGGPFFEDTLTGRKVSFEEFEDEWDGPHPPSHYMIDQSFYALRACKQLQESRGRLTMPAVQAATASIGVALQRLGTPREISCAIYAAALEVPNDVDCPAGGGTTRHGRGGRRRLPSTRGAVGG